MHASLKTTLFLFAYCSIFIISCSSIPKSNHCIEVSEYKKSVASMESIVLSMTGKNEPSIIESNKCSKIILNNAGYRIVVFRDFETSEVESVMSPARERVLDEDVSSCLSKARNDFKVIKIDFAPSILDLHSKKYSSVQNDPDLGPVRWLACKGDQVDWYRSLGTIIHELHHGLSSYHNDYSCLNLPSSEPLCISHDTKMPPISVAALETMPTKSKEGGQMFQRIQEIYVTKAGNRNHFFNLLDEMIGYVITLKTATNVLRYSKREYVIGVDFVNGKEKSIRDAVILPLFMVYVERYLDEFQRTEPKQFSKWYSENNKNIEFIRLLAKTTYLEWLNELNKQPKVYRRTFDIEDNLMLMTEEYNKKLKLK